MSTPSASSEAAAVIPAELSFLTIYNPSLADKDENFRDQIVFYNSKSNRTKRKPKAGKNNEGADHEEENEKLRQVGLAQGMVHFARNFSDGKPVDTIDTAKSRLILHELEPEWWILASIDLTKFRSSHDSLSPGSKVEYSSREVAPPQLLLQNLKSAHSIFLLHHAACLSDLYVRLPREKFCGILERFWTRFIWNWDVLLHGNPAVDVFNGTKLAAGGELGIGVGEEEWGSGEREVLEGFVSRTEGLVDLVVSRFGDGPDSQDDQSINSTGGSFKPRNNRSPWLGAGVDPRPSDGVLFSGIGNLSRRSLATVSQWMEMIYRHGADAYGVSESPSSTTRPRRRRMRTGRAPKIDSPAMPSNDGSSSPPHRSLSSMRRTAIMNQATSPGIPPPIVRAVDHPLDTATNKAMDTQAEEANAEAKQKPNEEPKDTAAYGTDKMMKYLTLGYGSSWSISAKTFNMQRRSSSDEIKQQETDSDHDSKQDETLPEENEEEPLQEVDPTPEFSDDESAPYVQRLEESIGKFIVGLSGDLENEGLDEGEADPPGADNQLDGRRIVLRTLTVEMSAQAQPRWTSQRTSNDPESSAGSENHARYHRLQVALYVHQPFMFTFLYSLHTSSLSLPSSYRSIHHQLGPLQKPLLSSTDPMKVAQRIEAAMGESHSTTFVAKNGPHGSSTPPQTIHDLVYDPRKLTVHTSIANIPAPGTLAAEGLHPSSSGSWMTLGIPTGSPSRVSPSSQTPGQVSPWTRIDALNVHTQILNTYQATRFLPSEIERTAKTSRGWWVLWMRIPQSSEDGDDENSDPREAFLVRQASDSTSTGNTSRIVPNRGWLARDRDISGSSAGTTSSNRPGTSGVAEGIGVDARRWIEGLLALNR